MKKKQLHKPKWLVTMLLLVMAILMPYEGAWAQTTKQPARGDADAEYYDASGRRTHGLQKGLNIVKHDGKTYKIMVK